jgi:hypothetical protein
MSCARSGRERPSLARAGCIFIILFFSPSIRFGSGADKHFVGADRSYFLLLFPNTCVVAADSPDAAASRSKKPPPALPAEAFAGM